MPRLFSPLSKFVFFAFCLFFPSATSKAAEIPAELVPFVAQSQQGRIDWDNGLIYGKARGYLKEYGNSRARAHGAAQINASASIMRLAAGINLDDVHTLQTAGDGRVVVRLKAFIQDIEQEKVYVENGGDPYWEVTRVAHITGIKGLTSNLLQVLQTFPAWSMFPKASETQELTDQDKPWLLIDARHLGPGAVAPALFPKVVSSEGKEIYNLRHSDKNAVIQRGMAKYVVQRSHFAGPLSTRTLVDTILARAGMVIAVPDVFAQDAGQVRKKRGNFIVSQAQGIKGLKKTNLVISEHDAARLKTEDAASAILKNCRVIVLTSSPVGGLESGRGDILLAALPF